MNKKVLQFEVWNECNNNCTFCSNKYVYDISTEEKMRNLDIIYDKIGNDQIFDGYNVIGLIGGEFFQGQLRNAGVKNRFMDVICRINDLINSGRLCEYWVTSTLISKNQDDLFEHLSKIDRKDKVWICTSYDTIGRFHNDNMLNQWKENVRRIHDYCKDIRINTTSILTGDFIRCYMEGKFNIRRFCEENGTTWFNKPPMLPTECKMTKMRYNQEILDNFFPKRKDFLEFLLKFRFNETEEEYDRLFNTNLRADSLIKTDIYDNGNRSIVLRNKDSNEEITNIVENGDYIGNKDNVLQVYNETGKNCKHNSGYSPYVDSDGCFYCDKEMIKNL